jgi:probable rRNA maturation factor
VILLDQETAGVRERALSLFVSGAKRAVGLREDINVRITSSHNMRELNRRFRRKNKATDVLSFPSAAPKMGGDIAISAEIAARNAAALGHSTETELKILILHGLLHLAGYDHEKDTGEMHAREATLRQQLKLPVGLIERTNAGGNGASATRSSVRRRR